MRYLVLGLFVLFVGLISVNQTTQASDPHVCLKTCMETYGADKKRACALQCGLGKGAASGGGQSRDCGTIYKNCMKSCGSNSSCKNQCRKQRTNCY